MTSIIGGRCHQLTRRVTTLSAEEVLSDSNKRKCLQLLESMTSVSTTKNTKDKATAAVLVPLCSINNKLSLLYTVRSPLLKVNGGEVSFPGGKQDKSDGTLKDTALRETFEEIGIPPESVDVWGIGPVIHRPDVMVTPFLGYIGDININSLRLNTSEVEMVFTATLDDLSNSDNFQSTRFRFGQLHVYTSPVYTGTHKRIWGLTAIITHSILSALISDIYRANIIFKPTVQRVFRTNIGKNISKEK